MDGRGTVGALEERELRRVRWRLAALIVALLFALLIALGGAVYITMQSALLQPLKQATELRGNVETDHLIELERGHTAGQESRNPFDEPEIGGVFIALANQRLTVLAASSSDPFGRRLPSPEMAKRALQSRSSLFSTAKVGTQRYLIYSKPVFRSGHVGVIQTGITEQQYEEGLKALLGVLVVVGGLGLLASAGITAVVVRRALFPVRASLQRQRDFVADAAHELRTPLTIMRSSAELGLASDELEAQQAALEQTLVQEALLARLVDDLSLLARADSGVLTLERAPVNLTDLVKNTAAGLEVLAEDREIRLETDLADDLHIVGDTGRIRQLLMILLDNALKHTPEGGQVEISAKPHGGRVDLRVHDSGAGIAPKDLPHVFDRFYRADRARTEQNGSGLGLAIGSWIAEAHGGHISAGNAPEGGAIFTVTLPLATRVPPS